MKTRLTHEEEIKLRTIVNHINNARRTSKNLEAHLNYCLDKTDNIKDLEDEIENVIQEYGH